MVLEWGTSWALGTSPFNPRSTERTSTTTRTTTRCPFFYQVTLISICFLSIPACSLQPNGAVLIQTSMERLHFLLRLLTYSPTTLGSTSGSERPQAKQIIWIFKIFLWILVAWGQNGNQLFAQVLPCFWSWPTFVLAASTSELLACYRGSKWKWKWLQGLILFFQWIIFLLPGNTGTAGTPATATCSPSLFSLPRTRRLLTFEENIGHNRQGDGIEQASKQKPPRSNHVWVSLNLKMI